MATDERTLSSGETILSGLNKVIPIAQVLAAIAFCVIAWYIGSQTNSYTQNSRLDALERRAEASEKLLDKLLTKELYEANRKADIERSERQEKMINQLLEISSRSK